MSTNTIFQKKTVVGTSNVSVSDAIEKVVKKFNDENPVSWFEVVEIRGRVTIEGNLEYQVTVNLGQKLK